MTNESPESDEFFELLSDLVDGDLPPPRAERLRDLLRDDPEAQDLYLEFMKLHAHLHLAYDSGSGPADMPGGSSMPLKPLSVSPFEPAVGGVIPEGLGDPSGVNSSGRFWPSSMAVGWALAGLLAVVLVFVSRPSEPRKVTVAAPPPAKVDVSKGLAVVVRTAGVRWESSDGRIPKEGDVLPECRLKVHEGRAMLSMLSGVTVTVEGPADIELLSMDRITCHRGKLRAKVPEGAEGFVVSGPNSAVIDLGTEFGVNMNSDGRSRGKVFKGEVEAAVLGTSGAPRHSRLVEETNGTFEIDPESGFIGPFAGPEDFVAPYTLPRDELGLDPGYRGSVLGSRPRCYWRFESGTEGRIPNEVPGGPPLLMTGPIRLAESAPGNRSAVFEAGQTNQYFRMDGFWKPERSAGYAIELWFLPEEIGLASLVSMVAPKDTTHHLSLVELTSSNRRSLVRPASIRFLYRWPTGRGGGDNVFSNDIYVPYRWHHLVAQLAGDRMELYLDGSVQTSQAIGPAGSTAPAQVILGRLTTLTSSNQIHHTGFRRPFVGLMDEVALYDHPLSAEEIRAHYRLASRPDRTD